MSPLVSVLVLLAAAWLSPVQGIDCISCQWINGTTEGSPSPANGPANPPALGLVFIHMRKAGGTSFLLFLREWVAYRKCFLSPPPSIIHGIREGIAYPVPIKNPPPQLCPLLEIRHVEFECLRGESLSRMAQRPFFTHNPLLKYFTILRHPVDRIVSQAYYNQFASFELERNVDIVCNCRGDRPKIVLIVARRQGKCYTEAFNITRQNVASNYSMWQSFFKQELSTRYGFMVDRYYKNYYITRLMMNDAKEQVSFNKSKHCLHSPDSCHSIPLPYSSEKVPDKLKPLDVMHNLAMPYRCCVGVPSPDTEKTLQDAIFILHNLVKYVIIEDLGSDKAAKVISSVLNEESIVKVKSLLQVHTNKGVNNKAAVMSPLRSYDQYKNVMPKEAYDFIIKDNADDIRLYEYAFYMHMNYSDAV